MSHGSVPPPTVRRATRGGRGGCGHANRQAEA